MTWRGVIAFLVAFSGCFSLAPCRGTHVPSPPLPATSPTHALLRCQTRYGAASIGEVHRARLLGGREVVVKVMYPGIEHKFRSDMSSIISFCKLAMPQHVKPLEEIEVQFMTEFDYQAEARNLKEVGDNIMPHFGKEVFIPQPITELCTDQVMVMEFVPGVQLVHGVLEQHRRCVCG